MRKMRFFWLLFWIYRRNFSWRFLVPMSIQYIIYLVLRSINQTKGQSDIIAHFKSLGIHITFYWKFYVRCGTFIVMKWLINRRNLLPCTVRTARKWSCNPKVGCLLHIDQVITLIITVKELFSLSTNSAIVSHFSLSKD